MMEVMETRLATVPGGKDGDAARTMRRELKARLAQVSGVDNGLPE